MTTDSAWPLSEMRVLDLSTEIRIRTGPLNHPNRATGYRIEFGGRAICYLTDTEHLASGVDPNLVSLVEGADIVIYDSMFTPEEYPARVGWGHSTWLEACRLCDAAEVETCVIFHHDPEHDDGFMDALQTEVAAHRPGTVVAYEGLVLEP